MREILFRGKRVDTKEWVYGYYFMGFTGIPYILVLHDHILEMTEFYEVIPETVGQFTGLLDKNNKKIFEGDILLCFAEGQQSKEIVEYSEYGWLPFIDQTGYLADTYSEFNYSRFEIIGNIHDNPELLT